MFSNYYFLIALDFQTQVFVKEATIDELKRLVVENAMKISTHVSKKAKEGEKL